MLDVDFTELRESFFDYLSVDLVIGAVFVAELLLVAMIGAIVSTLRHKSMSSARKLMCRTRGRRSLR